MLSDMQLDRIVDNIMATGGATFNANGLFSYLEGYQVGLAGCGVTHSLPKVDEVKRAVIDNKVRTFANRRWDLLEEGFDFGAWVGPDGVLYLDVTRHYSDGVLALKRAREMEEQAIWDWATMSEISAVGPNAFAITN